MKQTEILTHATHVNGWEPAVHMSCMSQNFRLFHVSNLSVRNFRIFLLMYTGILTSANSPVWRRKSTCHQGVQEVYLYLVQKIQEDIIWAPTICSRIPVKGLYCNRYYPENLTTIACVVVRSNTISVPIVTIAMYVCRYLCILHNAYASSMVTSWTSGSSVNFLDLVDVP